MQTYTNLLRSNISLPKCSLAIGSFDGLHLGHQKILEHLPVPRAVLSFNPSPKDFFRESSRPQLLPRRLKEEVFREFGIDFFIVEAFDQSLADLEPKSFLVELKKRIDFQGVSCGPDFRFGKNRMGDLKDFRDLVGEVWINEELFVCGTSVRTSNIVEKIEKGSLSEAKALLGRPYMIEGNVESGAARGRTIGFPTLNIAAPEMLVPKNGVYAAFLSTWRSSVLRPRLSELLPAVVNIGVRPTVSTDEQRTIECHSIGEVLHTAEGQYCQIFFIDRLRDEQKFENLSQLKEQISSDVIHAKKILEDVLLQSQAS